MKILNKYYSVVDNSDVLALVKKLGLKIDWVVEAGCHDGTDTILINASLSPKQIFAFEPDPSSFKKAKDLFDAHLENVSLSPFGLSNENRILFFNFPNEKSGTGSTMLTTEGESSVEVRRLDEVVKDVQYGGLLWLDVEGHAAKALMGASKVLPNLRIAKIEIQMHNMNEIRLSDFQEVCKLMKQANLVPLYAPIHPGFFGDILFVNVKELSPGQVLYSKVLLLEMLLLHKIVYPLLGKPKMDSKHY